MAIDRTAQADIVGHAKESLDAEICGVLAGRLCEDDEGLFVQVEAAIRGTAAQQGSTHVTFTQATWEAIHATLDRDFPALRIVGWYHSHPGFGVEFSEMDLFIQRNFFPGPAQIAVVLDPLRGAMACCVNTPGGIQYVPRVWVGGREQFCLRPPTSGASSTSGEGMPPPGTDTANQLKDLEDRVNTLVQAVDEQRAALQRFLLFAGLVFCTALVLSTGYCIYQLMRARMEPPKNVGFAAVPVDIAGHPALLGVQIVSWELPPELDLLNQAVEKLKAQLQSAGRPGSSSNSPAPNSSALGATNVPPKLRATGTSTHPN